MRIPKLKDSGYEVYASRNFNYALTTEIKNRLEVSLVNSDIEITDNFRVLVERQGVISIEGIKYRSGDQRTELERKVLLAVADAYPSAYVEAKRRLALETGTREKEVIGRGR